MDFNIYKNDLLHRKPGFSFVETPDGDRTKVEFKDVGLNVIFEASDIFIADAYKSIMINVLEGYNPSIFLSTTSERDALTLASIPLYIAIWNIDTDRMECFDGAVFTSASGATIIGAGSYGAMFENKTNGRTLSTITSTLKGWTTATEGVVDTATIVTFSDNSTADRLVVGAGGAGDYHIAFSSSFTNSGGNTTTAAIYLNDVEQVSIKDTSESDSSKHRNLVSSGILTLAVNDYIDLRYGCESGDAVKIYQCQVNINKE